MIAVHFKVLHSMIASFANTRNNSFKTRGKSMCCVDRAHQSATVVRVLTLMMVNTQGTDMREYDIRLCIVPNY